MSQFSNLSKGEKREAQSRAGTKVEQKVMKARVEGESPEKLRKKRGGKTPQL